MSKLLSVNIEGKKHIDKIIDLIAFIESDVVCMQEVFEDTMPQLNEYFGGTYFFSPILLKAKDWIDKTDEELKQRSFETVLHEKKLSKLSF